jgi:4-hydroxybenzoate polyprenyltransferase
MTEALPAQPAAGVEAPQLLGQVSDIRMTTPASTDFSDIAIGNWLERLLPPRFVPYSRLARLDRPIGWWLLLLPCWWSVALAPRAADHLWLFLLFWVGAVVMRGAGCTFNDIIDREIDAKVERTRRRPLPSGQVSVREAVIFMAAQLAVGAIVLFSLNQQAIMLGLAVLVIVGTYPFMKRLTFYPQLFLGLSFNWGALVGWAASTGTLALPAILLYLAGIAWTLGYDTIYAHQDARDDVAAGVKSMALRFGARSRVWVAGFYTASVVALVAALSTAGTSGLSYLVLSLAAGHFAWQVTSWRPESPPDCLAKFRSNRIAGLLVFAACLAGSWR